MFTRFRGFAVALSVAVALTAATGASAEVPDVVDQIPPDAQLFVATQPLEDLSREVAAFGDQLGLRMPQLSDPLATLRQMTGIQEGVDETRGIALVALSLPVPALPEGQGPPQPPGPPEAVILVPVDDYDAFLGNFGASGDQADQPTQVRIQGRPTFVKQAGEWAVLSPMQPVVANFQPAGDGDDAADHFLEHAGDLGGSILNESEALFYLDFAALAQDLRPLVEAGISEAREQAKAQADDPATPDAETIEALFDAYSQAVDAVLRDGQAITAGINLDDTGFALSAAAQFEPGSELANAFDQAPEQSPSLNRLPNRPFLVATSLDFSTIPFTDWLQGLVDALPEDSPWRAMIGSGASLDLGGDRQQQALYAPEMGGGGGGPGGGPFGMMGPSLFNGVTVYPTDQPEELIEQNRQALESLKDVDLGEGQASYDVEYEENALEVEGRPVHRYRVRFEDIPPQQMQQFGPFAAFLSQGLSGYVTHTENAVIVTSSTDQNLLLQAVEAAAGDGNLATDAGVERVRQLLPPNRIGETYIGVGPIMEIAAQFMGMFAPQQQEIEVPQDVPPIANSISVNAGGLHTQLLIPSETITAIRDLVQQFTGGGGPPITLLQSGAAGPGAAAPGASPASSGGVMELTTDNFQQIVNQAPMPVVVDFWAPWAGEAKAQEPVLQKVAEQYGQQIVAGKVNIDENPQLQQQYNIEAIPTLLIFQNGQIAKRIVGLTYEEKLSENIDEVLGNN